MEYPQVIDQNTTFRNSPIWQRHRYVPRATLGIAVARKMTRLYFFCGGVLFALTLIALWRGHPHTANWLGLVAMVSFATATLGAASRVVCEDFLTQVDEDLRRLADVLNKSVKQLAYQIPEEEIRLGSQALLLGDALVHDRLLRAATDATFHEVYQRLCQESEEADKILTAHGDLLWRFRFASKGTVHLLKSEVGVEAAI